MSESSHSRFSMHWYDGIKQDLVQLACCNPLMIVHFTVYRNGNTHERTSSICESLVRDSMARFTWWKPRWASPLYPSPRRMVYAVGVFMQRCRDMHRVGWSVIVIIRTSIPWSQFSCVHGSCIVLMGMHKCEFVCSLPAPFHSVLAC